jgi:hypothetical protein
MHPLLSMQTISVAWVAQDAVRKENKDSKNNAAAK